MKITEISVSWKETCSIPGEYSNVTPEFGLKAALGDFDNPDEVREQLLNEVKQHVQSRIDNVLEAHNESPKYSDEPLFRLRYSRDEKLYVIVPNDERLLREMNGFFDIYGLKPMRLSKIRAEAQRKTVNRENSVLIDCSDGDLSKLPKPKENEEEIPI